jgi:transposase
MRDHYRFMLRQQLKLIDALDGQIGELDAQIEHSMLPFAEAYRLLQMVPGVAQRGAQAILAEIGVDMSPLSQRGAACLVGAALPGQSRKRRQTSAGQYWARQPMAAQDPAGGRLIRRSSFIGNVCCRPRACLAVASRVVRPHGAERFA